MNKITIHQSVLDVSRKIAPKILKKNININIFINTFYKYFNSSESPMPSC